MNQFLSLPRTKEKLSDVLFVGYAEADLGLGQAFRSMMNALENSGATVSIYPFDKNVESRRIGPFLEKRYDRTGLYDIIVAYMAVDQLPHYFELLKLQKASPKYMILRTYWELPEAPTEWRSLLHHVDELWVPNVFVGNAFRQIFDRTITVIPVCINVCRNQVFAREHFGLDKSRFYFMYSFDYYSTTTRKNPTGVLQSFSYAFPDLEESVGLIVKTTGPNALDPTVSRFLANASQVDQRVKIVEGYMSRDEILSLIDNSDCYISLHRSEGFGMGMAEAMALGKPVIGTGFSGNSDFLTTYTGFPISFTLRKLMPGEYPFSEGQYWAEPDITDAVSQLRYVVKHPGDRLRRASAGCEFVTSVYSDEVVARIIIRRLSEIRSDLSHAAVRPARE